VCDLNRCLQIIREFVEHGLELARFEKSLSRGILASNREVRDGRDLPRLSGQMERAPKGGHLSIDRRVGCALAAVLLFAAPKCPIGNEAIRGYHLRPVFAENLAQVIQRLLDSRQASAPI